MGAGTSDMANTLLFGQLTPLPEGEAKLAGGVAVTWAVWAA